jgi:Na+/glutamate symporter
MKSAISEVTNNEVRRGVVPTRRVSGSFAAAGAKGPRASRALAVGRGRGDAIDAPCAGVGTTTSGLAGAIMAGVIRQRREGRNSKKKRNDAEHKPPPGAKAGDVTLAEG